MNHWELYVFGALPVFAAALSTVHLEGWFLCVTTALPFLPPLASIIRFIMVADPKAEDGNRKRVAVMVMHYCIDPLSVSLCVGYLIFSFIEARKKLWLPLRTVRPRVQLDGRHRRIGRGLNVWKKEGL
eukprot:Selendium_serpulae@DN3810_c0_g1_i1.p1